MLKFRNLGAKYKFKHDLVGINSRLDTIQASILLNKINYLNQLNSKRQKIAHLYNKLIKNKNITKLNYSKGCVFHQYVILTKKPAKFRNYLISKRIPYGRHYPKSLNMLGAVKGLFKNQKYKNSELLANKGTSLPMNPLLKKNDVLKICKLINKFN